ncbi:hypothetical protein [Rheinheimera sp. 1928-s]|uniref:hypothetical protein n=1 Tax=Rheinheimera sp. 1928-s TaxID=3033803 RepID=UPI002637D4FA|nr:hypothetical protein [Rheinheimera sp. 1928-s]MDF3125326.1 hypothetical protein [Rheinheimera sp. 1928-s]
MSQLSVDQKLSLAQELSDGTVDKIVAKYAMKEVLASDGGPFMTLISHLPMAQGVVGKVRIFAGGPLHKLVTCSIVVPQIQLDSHMLYGFMPADSAVPHFTLDSVKAGEHFAFHLDLTPRVDLGAHTDYMNQVFWPLTDKFNAAEALDGIEQAHISPRQRAIMSPWMLVHRATETAFKTLFSHVDGYLKYWYGLVDQGVDSPVSATELAVRDKANRAAIFSPEIDPVWKRIEGLIGTPASEQLRAILRGE